MKSEKIVRTEEEWKKILTPEQYRIARLKGTEAPFTGKYNLSKEDGSYTCAACGHVVFSSSSEFDSGCGWPSFDKPAAQDSVEERPDTSHGMKRTEITCSRCGAHLGHVFDDGPTDTGLRYCINSGILGFTKTAPTNAPNDGKSETATFAAGCFWGIEAAFRKLDGIRSTSVGYTGGRTENPTYKQVCTGETGHAEAVAVVFDPAKTTYGTILAAFWDMHDPTQINRQGPDHGSQYRSVIFFHSNEQKAQATASLKRLEKSRRHKRPIATSIEPAGPFWKAEEYHQQYLEKRGQASCRL